MDAGAGQRDGRRSQRHRLPSGRARGAEARRGGRGGRTLRRDPGPHAPPRRGPGRPGTAAVRPRSARAGGGDPGAALPQDAGVAQAGRRPRGLARVHRRLGEAQRHPGRGRRDRGEAGPAGQGAGRPRPGLAGRRHLAAQPGGAGAAGPERPAVPAVRRHPARRHRQGRRPQPAVRPVGDDRLAAREPPGRLRLGHRRLALGHLRAPRRRARRSSPWSGCWLRPGGRPTWPRRWSSTWTSSATPTAARP